MGHDMLLNDLALAKGTIYKNVNLGSHFLSMYAKGEWRKDKKGQNIYVRDGVPRADIVTIKPSYTRFLIDIYEIKATRSDFLSDINSEKWEKYLPHCNRFYFAVLKGIITKKDIPLKAGLYIYGVNGWYCSKHALKRDVEIPLETLQSLLFYHQKFNEHRYWLARVGGYLYSDELKKLGKKIQRAVAHYNTCELVREEEEENGC